MLMHEGFQASVSECRSFASPRELILLRASQLTHCTSLRFYLNRKNQGKILVFQFCAEQDPHWFVRKPCVDSEQEERSLLLFRVFLLLSDR